MPEDLLKRIKNHLNVIPKEIKTLYKLYKTSLEPVKHLLTEFTTNSIIKPLLDAPQPQKDSTPQTDQAIELAHIRNSLQMLNKAVSGL